MGGATPSVVLATWCRSFARFRSASMVSKEAAVCGQLRPHIPLTSTCMKQKYRSWRELFVSTVK